MTSGGHARSGPPPDPNAIRRDRKSDQLTWLTLTGNREGPAPAWPLTESTKREDAMWARLWTTPQATQWEAQGWHDEVALYVRTFCRASAQDGSTADRTLVLRQMEGLGLSAAGMSRLRWRLPTTDTAPVRKEARTRDARRASDKARFQVIEGEAKKAG